MESSSHGGSCANSDDPASSTSSSSKNSSSSSSSSDASSGLGGGAGIVEDDDDRRKKPRGKREPVGIWEVNGGTIEFHRPGGAKHPYFLAKCGCEWHDRRCEKERRADAASRECTGRPLGVIANPKFN